MIIPLYRGLKIKGELQPISKFELISRLFRQNWKHSSIFLVDTKNVKPTVSEINFCTTLVKITKE